MRKAGDESASRDEGTCTKRRVIWSFVPTLNFARVVCRGNERVLSHVREEAKRKNGWGTSPLWTPTGELTLSGRPKKKKKKKKRRKVAHSFEGEKGSHNSEKEYRRGGKDGHILLQ